jgi:hypothetical protein
MSDRSSDQIAARLAVFEDEREVLRTLHQYGHSIDYGLEEAWLDCFCDDGAFDVRYRIRPDRSYRHHGRAALASYIAGHTRAPGSYHKHCMVEPVIVVSGHDATVASYFLRVDFLEAPTIVAMGRYRDTMVRSSDGRFRFRERVCEVENR